MKVVRVVAAIICRKENEVQQILATQRGYGSFQGGWEFPGGKIEEGETPEQALIREIHEELDTQIKVGKLVSTVEYDYPDFHLSMQCYTATVESGHLTLLEHEASKWLSKENLRTVEWLPADISLIDEIESKWEDIHKSIEEEHS